MAKKGTKIWVFTTLTFAKLDHLIDAATALLSNNQAQALSLLRRGNWLPADGCCQSAQVG